MSDTELDPNEQPIEDADADAAADADAEEAGAASEPAADETAEPQPQAETQPESAVAEEEAASSQAEEQPEPDAPEDPATPSKPGMGWYVLRVASNKEERVRDALDRKVKIEGLEDHIGRILVPTVKEKTIRRGRARIVQRKLYAGYVFVEMATESDGSIPENVWFLVKETTGVGDFIQSDGRPTSMKDIEVERMLSAVAQPEEEAALSAIRFRPGDRVKIREGPFENFEGDVEGIDEHKGMVTVLLTIFGRQSPVDVEYWNVESL